MRTPRGTTRILTTAVAAGALAGLAGLAAALVPPAGVGALVADEAATTTGPAAVVGADDAPGGSAGTGAGVPGGPPEGTPPVGGDLLPISPPGGVDGALLVGAARRSIAPAPDGDAGEVWQTDRAACATLTPEGAAEALGAPVDTLDHLVTAGSPWPENPDCIYTGGFGIGPMNPVESFDDELGLWVRAVSVSDGQDTVVLAVVDGVGWFWEYGQRCPECGAKQIGQRMAAELDIDADGIIVQATHSHAAPDFMGGWGYVPEWYHRQVTAAIDDAIRAAVTGAVPAVVEVGEELARGFNSERRDTYRSAEEQQLTWLRALELGPGGRLAPDPPVVATLAGYAAHPTRFGTNDGVAHPDWPGLLVHELEQRHGGVGVLAMTGLGNMSGAGDRDLMGAGLADLLPPVGAGRRLAGDDVRVEQVTWRQPVTNAPLTALGLPGFFDRRFDPVPAQVAVGKSEASPCTSASAVSVELPATVAWLGDDLALTTGPGELFANATNTVRERSGARTSLPLAQANDSLGYMPQSFEFSRANQQGAGFGFGGVAGVNYEDSYAIDACTGDMWLETVLDQLAALR